MKQNQRTSCGEQTLRHEHLPAHKEILISNVANALLTVSSCKNHKKYFAIKWIISLFRCVKKMQATFTIPFSGSFIMKAATACPSIITISTITIITG
jgi:hypothetical protein